MTLDGHEDWVRWGRNRVGLWGRHAAWGWGWMRFVGVFWWLEGVSNQQFFFSHGCKTRSWIAHISHIHDVQRMPQVVHCLSEKDTPQRTCVIKCDGCTILMIWHLYTHTHYIWCIHIYIYIYVHANKKDTSYMSPPWLKNRWKNCWTCATQDRQLLAWWWGNLVQLISDVDGSEIWWGNHLLDPFGCIKP